MQAKDLYLVAYNGLCCVGWAGVWLFSLQALLKYISDGASPLEASARVYGSDNVALWLSVAQSAALLEIMHSAARLVRSPVMVTIMQVMSRIVALVAIAFSPSAQNQWGAGLMILSWASVEVPRYAFYVAALITGDATKKTPYALFWLRYSLFAVLYPSGIIGELTVFLAAAKDPAFVDKFTSAATLFYGTVLPIVYFFGSPFMIMNMVGNRKSAFKKRFAKPPPPPRGLCWPVDEKGERSSTKVNQAIVAAAVGAVNESKAKAILKTKGWRFGYWKHLKALVEEQCTSPEAALKIAQSGLDKAYELFEFVAPDGSAVSYKEAMSKKATEKFETMVIKGTGKSKVEKLEVPYKGETLSGQKLIDQVNKWVDYGTIEPSAGEAIIKCVENPEWIKKNSDRYFVLLGAGSAMGPLLVLLSIGANVVAVDLDRPMIWKRLIGLARDSMGTLTFPVKADPKTLKTDEEIFASAGCNLFTHTPMIRDWLVDLYPNKPFAVGSYAYLNGALHVQVSLAMDGICRDLSEKRRNVSLAYLCTPTDLHLIPEEAQQASLEAYDEYKSKPYCMLLSMMSGGKFLRKNAKKPVSGKGGDYYLVNGISVAQGPNYALAKRMQHWRAIIARSQGCTVSSNIAPSTSTVSVVQNRTFAWAYEGMPYFKPYEIFAPETSNAVMSAILMYDLNDPKSSGNPKTPHSNPNQLFSYGSFHGGVWRCAYEIDSIGEASVFLYFGRVAQPYLLAAGGVVAAGAAAYFGMAK
mmetsp:Transcript_20526/g.56660  ORF Transcript_20526/g.56660 Transcript_20526/m.56660 type:complete len:751 (+) Transcript_20526:108-2360(+)|eukprot:CAMPEP_0168743780 /NCGR_PEP_ID=MMETSP0724-20121128/13754_1 /TAXON_ID=265536 /ORGANISM="Amphiprora sp., Strain CCMP467" /LENGTH=750 /DNA_ID=CAMNT_0008791423 /DNA_START=41 /DNA_END=2293 /DNA_ORIENTATION=+